MLCPSKIVSRVLPIITAVLCLWQSASLLADAVWTVPISVHSGSESAGPGQDLIVGVDSGAQEELDSLDCYAPPLPPQSPFIYAFFRVGQYHLACDIRPASSQAWSFNGIVINTETDTSFVRWSRSHLPAGVEFLFSNGNQDHDMRSTDSVMVIGIWDDIALRYLASFTIQASSSLCQLVIVHPDGGQMWCAGEQESINWTSENTSGHVKIEYSTNNGSTWQTVLASTEDDGSYVWTVPETVSGDCLVRVCDASDPGCCDQSSDIFTICGLPQAEFSGDPVSGQGTTCEVHFTDQSFGCVTGRIWDFGDGMTSSQQNPIHVYSCGGIFTVSLNVSGPCGSDSETKQGCISCTCDHESQLTITSPNGGEIWCSGQQENIRWASTATSGSVKIDYWIDGGSSWQTIETGTPDDGTYLWTIPDAPPIECLMRICDVSDSTQCDLSNGTFQICQCGLIRITNTILPKVTIGCSYRATVNVSGGCRPYSWSIVSGHVPAGLGLNESSGQIEGIPTILGSFPFTVRVEDVMEATDEREYTIDVEACASIKADVNGDCIISVLDVVQIVNVILGTVETQEDQIWRADCDGQIGFCNGDGVMNILDAMKVINIILEIDECP